MSTSVQYTVAENSISRIVHVTSWLSRQGGGIPPVIWNLARQTNRLGIDCSVAGLNDPWVNDDCARQQVPFAAGTVKGLSGFGFSPDLSAQVRSIVTPGSVIHSHGLWMYPGVVARKCARRAGCPLVVSPHGMLEPWALKNSGWKKQIASHLFEKGNLGAANCLHALCLAEAKSIRGYGLRNPIAIVPNGVDIEEFDRPADAVAIRERFPELRQRRCLLFLSRLHPKKGLEMLFHVWRRLSPDFRDWCVLIVGSGHTAYERALQSLVKELRLEDSICFGGAVYGQDKKLALAAANGFILPSFSEGFSVALLEAAAAGLPVVLTHECNFPELAAAGAGVETAAAREGIESGLRQVLEMSDHQRSAMGQKGRELVRRAYAWPEIAGQMLQVYEWLLGCGVKPACVV